MRAKNNQPPRLGPVFLNITILILSFAVVLLIGTAASALTFTVNSIGDQDDATPGDNVCQTTTPDECTLRAAIQEANTTAALDTINFNISGCPGGICTINVAATDPSRVLEATNPVYIDGSTQPGNDTVCTSSIPNRPSYKIVLKGTSQEPGLRLATGSNGSTIRGLNLQNFLNTIAIIDSRNNTVECNFVGTDETGMSAASGNKENALLLGCNSTGNVIGGPDPEDGNIFSAHEYDGVQIVGGGCPPNEPDSNYVLGNFIGVAKDGVTPLGNGYSGVSMFDGTGPDDNLVGLMPDGGGGFLYNANVISANGTGVYIGADVTGAVIAGNAIGTDLSGTVNLGNFYDGVYSEGGPLLIGGTDPKAPNLIAFNDNGVTIYGDAALGNQIQRNSIFSNVSLGIDLGLDGVTPNDPYPDSDTGPNDLQNFPVIQSVALNGANLDITYSVPSPGTLTVEFFIADASGQGKTFLGQATYSANGGTVTATVPAGAATNGTRIVATATAAPIDDYGDTSEFSAEACVGSCAAPIPTLSEWGMIIFMLIAGLGSVWFMKRKKI
jgi:CSLREA domain-containing protein